MSERQHADYVVAGFGYPYPPDTSTKAELAASRSRPRLVAREPSMATIEDGAIPCTICHGTGWFTPNRGERNGNAKLTAAQVQAIRRRYARGEKAHVLAELFGVNPENIAHIVKRRSWRHVP